MKGAKTYTVGILSLLGAVAGAYTGTIPMAEAIQLGVTAITAMTIRNAIK